MGVAYVLQSSRHLNLYFVCKEGDNYNYQYSLTKSLGTTRVLSNLP